MCSLALHIHHVLHSLPAFADLGALDDDGSLVEGATIINNSVAQNPWRGVGPIQETVRVSRGPSQ